MYITYKIVTTHNMRKGKNALFHQAVRAGMEHINVSLWHGKFYPGKTALKKINPDVKYVSIPKNGIITIRYTGKDRHINSDKVGGYKGRKNTTAIEDVLSDRKKTHGSFEQHAAVAQSLKKLVLVREDYTDKEREALEMICHKLARIVSGDPHFKDHWVDISGYAQLV